eukprot:1157973-Pelagomonas_calceolata.AAC.4
MQTVHESEMQTVHAVAGGRQGEGSGAGTGHRRCCVEAPWRVLRGQIGRAAAERVEGVRKGEVFALPSTPDDLGIYNISSQRARRVPGAAGACSCMWACLSESRAQTVPGAVGACSCMWACLSESRAQAVPGAA